MLQVITTEFIEKFNALNNKCVDVCIKHILYGTQRIKRCVLHTLWNGERIGFTINEEDIYITMDELQNASINDNECIIKSEVMELYIML